MTPRRPHRWLHPAWGAASRVPTSSNWCQNSDRAAFNHYTTSQFLMGKPCDVRLIFSMAFLQQAPGHILESFLDWTINVKVSRRQLLCETASLPGLQLSEGFPVALRTPPNLLTTHKALMTRAPFKPSNVTSYHSSPQPGGTASMPSFCSLNKPNSFLPQGLCTCSFLPGIPALFPPLGSSHSWLLLHHSDLSSSVSFWERPSHHNNYDGLSLQTLVTLY